MQPAANPYLRTKILTASPEELRLMLYDGAIKFARHARTALDERRYEEMFTSLTRAQKIVLELSTSLKPEIDPDLCGKLGALYNYIYRLLVDAHVEKSTRKLDEAIELLSFERQTWQLLIQKLADENRSAAAAALDIVEHQQTALSSLSRSA